MNTLYDDKNYVIIGAHADKDYGVVPFARLKPMTLQEAHDEMFNIARKFADKYGVPFESNIQDGGGDKEGVFLGGGNDEFFANVDARLGGPDSPISQVASFHVMRLNGNEKQGYLDLKRFNVFKINSYPYSSSRFIAVKTFDDLCVFCARLVHDGFQISSVCQMLDFSPNTPRIAIKNERVFKDELKRLKAEDKEKEQ